MTKEPIMIDDVDITECEHKTKVYEDYKCEMYNLEQCSNFHNCYFKQLKRKEQECDQLKKELDITSCANIELSLEIKKYEKAIDEIEEIADNNYENPEMQRIFNIIGGLDV